MLINADGGFSATYNEVTPPYIGTGFFGIVRNQVTDFEFSMLGFAWDESDVGSCTCIVFESALDVIGIPFADEQGSGLLFWDFNQGIFSITFAAGEFDFLGTSESGAVTGALSDFEHSITVAEPGTALLLGLALILSSRFMRR